MQKVLTRTLRFSHLVYFQSHAATAGVEQVKECRPAIDEKPPCSPKQSPAFAGHSFYQKTHLNVDSAPA
jgi:hypothetical protein